MTARDVSTRAVQARKYLEVAELLDHGAAVAMLERVAGTQGLASALGRLLSQKNATQYSPALLSPGRAKDMLGWARRLVDAIPPPA